MPITEADGAVVSLVRAVYWPRGGLRVAWLRGTMNILTQRFDVIVCPENVHNLSIWVFAGLHRLFGSRLVLHGHGKRTRLSQGPWIGGIRNLARRVLLARADAIITYSDRGRADVMEMGIKPDRVFVAQNTLDIVELRTAQRDVLPGELENLRIKHQLEPGGVVLFVGRLQRVKRVDLLIEAVRLRQTQGGDCSLLIIGDGPERGELESAASGMKGVHFLGELYDVRTLAPYFLIADVLAIPGRIGLTCVHGFAYGVPVITCSELLVSQSPEYDYIADGINAVVLEELSAEAVARALADLLPDHKRLMQLRNGASSTADRLHMDVMVQGFVKAVAHAWNSSDRMPGPHT